jgi:hypothetical protein
VSCAGLWVYVWVVEVNMGWDGGRGSWEGEEREESEYVCISSVE